MDCDFPQQLHSQQANYDFTSALPDQTYQDNATFAAGGQAPSAPITPSSLPLRPTPQQPRSRMTQAAGMSAQEEAERLGPILRALLHIFEMQRSDSKPAAPRTDASLLAGFPALQPMPMGKYPLGWSCPLLTCGAAVNDHNNLTATTAAASPQQFIEGTEWGQGLGNANTVPSATSPPLNGPNSANGVSAICGPGQAATGTVALQQFLGNADWAQDQGFTDSVPPATIPAADNPNSLESSCSLDSSNSPNNPTPPTSPTSWTTIYSLSQMGTGTMAPQQLLSSVGWGQGPDISDAVPSVTTSASNSPISPNASTTIYGPEQAATNAAAPQQFIGSAAWGEGLGITDIISPATATAAFPNGITVRDGRGGIRDSFDGARDGNRAGRLSRSGRASRGSRDGSAGSPAPAGPSGIQPRTRSSSKDMWREGEDELVVGLRDAGMTWVNIVKTLDRHTVKTTRERYNALKKGLIPRKPSRKQE